MNTLTGYSKNKLSDNYLLTAAGGHLAAGVENGSAAIYVSWPTYSKLKELNYIDANYGTGDYGHPDEEFLKGICKWAIANYSGSSCTLLGAIAPNSSGTCCMHLYGNSGFDATTKLPRYCMGWYQTLGGQLRYFGTSDYIWKYSEYARKADIKNPVNYYWANVPISDKSSSTTTPTFGNTVTLNSTSDVILNLTRTSKSSWRFLNSANLRIQNNYTSDVVDYFDVVEIAYNTGNVTLKGSLTASSSSDTVGIPLVLKNTGWKGGMSTAIDFYNGGSYTTPNARIETKMVTSGASGGTLIFYTQTKHESTNPNTNGLTERLRISDDGLVKITGNISVTGEVTTNLKFSLSNTGSVFPSHYFHQMYSDAEEVYVHYYPSNRTSESFDSFANFRVKHDASYKTLRFGGDGSFTWDGKNVLTSGNYTNYVNATNFPGLNKTGTVTSVTVTGANGLSGGGTVTTSGTITLSNAGVRSTTINGNYLRVNTNGTNADLTIPYASVAGKLSIGSYDKSSEIDFTKVFWTANSNDGDSVTGFGYAAVMNVGSSLHRGWQVWNSRNDHTLYWRPAKSDASAWADVHAILDSANYTSYTVKKDGTGASGTWGINISGSAASAGHLKVVSCHNGTTNNDLWSTIKSSNSAYLGTSTMYEVYNDGGPTTYGHVLDTVTVHTNHWLSLLWMASGKDGKIYYRNKDYNDNSWGGWKTVAWTSEIPIVTDYYWANISISASSNEATKPTFDLVRIISGSYPGLLVKRSNSTNSAIIALANSNGVLGGIGTSGSANSGLRRYKHDYSTSYLIFDENNSSVSGGGSSWGSSITVNLGGTAKTLTIPSAPTSISGNAGTATTLQTARTISLSTGVVATPTSFNGSANISIPVTEIKEGYLTWGGKNHAGAFGPIDAGLVPLLGANRLAFMPAEGVTVEVSTNGGSSWTTYPSITDEAKIALFNGNGTELYLGGSAAKKIDKSNYKVRVTIDTSLAKVYTELRKFIINVSTYGSTGSYCTITTRTLANYEAGVNTWVTQAENVALSGWSGWNVINVAFTTYGNNSRHHRQIRLTFGCTSHPSTLDYAGLHIIKIIGIGGVGWTTPSTMALTGNIFSYDNYQGVEFPGNIYPKANNVKTLGTSSRKWSNVYATTFTGNLTGNVTGNLTGNVTGNVSGSSGSCTGNAATATKLGTDTKGSTSKPIYLNAGTPTECSTYAGGTAVTLNGSSKAGSTASFYAPTTAGTSGLVLTSNGSGAAPTWQTISTGGGYIGRTPVLTNAAAQSLTGIGNITPETADSYKLGTSDKPWYLIFGKYFTSGKVSLRSSYNADTAVNTGYLEYTSTNGYFYITANSIAAGTSGGFVMKTTKNGVVSLILLESTSSYGQVKTIGDLYIGGRISNTTALISSDATYNMYLSVGGKPLLVCDSSEVSVRGGVSCAGDTTLGTTNYPWKAVYSKQLCLKSSNYTNTINPSSGNYTYLFPSVGGTLLVDTLGVLCKGWTKLTFSYDSTNSNFEERVYSTSIEKGGENIFNTGNGGLIYYEYFDLVGILLYLPSLTNIMYWGFTDNGTIVFLPNCSYGNAGKKGLRVYCKNYSGTILTSGSGILFFIKF